MRAQGLLLLAALLALGSQLPSTVGWKKGEKSGGCPPDDGPCLQAIPNQCMVDRHCPTGKKCCSRACFLQCLPKVKVKRGQCPTDPLYCLSPTQHLCKLDKDCSGRKRCCPGACGRDCRDPARDIGQEVLDKLLNQQRSMRPRRGLPFPSHSPFPSLLPGRGEGGGIYAAARESIKKASLASPLGEAGLKLSSTQGKG
ncbi:WAP four-disulfide core domain protein 5-like [Dromiciops gliroides]|uniref:WAP four-disulfide core domain protein 5-like n=1 Tax=Dromiciops gliroides TaxID=33562 RepID=UPI001CC7D9C9|nr:WAP four-disulfide core domain protein 5-like [Dromiciops gliroides]